MCCEKQKFSTTARILGRIDAVLRRIAMAFIRLYQRLLGPLLGGHCRFYPSCSNYALEAFQRRSFATALGKTLWRLARCHPFHPGGYDPVEPDDDPAKADPS